MAKESDITANALDPTQQVKAYTITFDFQMNNTFCLEYTSQYGYEIVFSDGFSGNPDTIVTTIPKSGSTVAIGGLYYDTYTAIPGMAHYFNIPAFNMTR